VPLRAPQVFPNDQRSWDQWTRSVPVTPDDSSVTTITIADKAVTNAKLRDSGPASVVGRLDSSPGEPSDISAAADNTFLVRRSGTLAFGTVGDGDIPASIARDSEVAAGDAAVTTAFQAADTAAAAAVASTLTAYDTRAVADTRNVLASNVLNGSATYDPPSLVDAAGTTTTVTVTGAALGDFALASFSLDLQGITVSAYVSAANTVSVRFQNESGGTLDLASGTLKARVWK
jgi:hypothetical protein